MFYVHMPVITSSLILNYTIYIFIPHSQGTHVHTNFKAHYIHSMATETYTSYTERLQLACLKAIYSDFFIIFMPHTNRSAHTNIKNEMPALWMIIMLFNCLLCRCPRQWASGFVQVPWKPSKCHPGGQNTLACCMFYKCVKNIIMKLMWRHARLYIFYPSAWPYFPIYCLQCVLFSCDIR